MAKIFKISTIILVLIVICAPSCEDEQETANRDNAMLKTTQAEIRKEFEKDYLDDVSLFAYEATAKQKLSDLADYLQILVDTSLDISFRIKAGELIKGTFLSDKINLLLIQQELKEGKESKVQSIIKKGLNNKLKLQAFSVDSIHILEPLHRIGNNTYTGNLKFCQVFTNPSQTEQKINSESRNADIFLVKDDKIFGTDTLKIWSVRLGEIR